MRLIIRQLRPAIVALFAFTLVCGVAYPLAVTAIGQVAFKDEVEGSLVRVQGVVVGSELIGQTFAAPEYFHGRPSAAGAGYDSTASSGSNLGPYNADLLTAVADRVQAYRAENGLADSQLVPVDAVTASASGLDPDISVANARIQAARVAKERDLTVAQVLALVEANTDGRFLGVLGEPGVNVVVLNAALDDLS